FETVSRTLRLGYPKFIRRNIDFAHRIVFCSVMHDFVILNLESLRYEIIFYFPLRFRKYFLGAALNKKTAEVGGLKLLFCKYQIFGYRKVIFFIGSWRTSIDAGYRTIRSIFPS